MTRRTSRKRTSRRLRRNSYSYSVKHGVWISLDGGGVLLSVHGKDVHLNNAQARSLAAGLNDLADS